MNEWFIEYKLKYIIYKLYDKDKDCITYAQMHRKMDEACLGEIQLQNGIFLDDLKNFQNRSIDFNFVFYF